MSAPVPDDQRLAFEREKWADELKLRQRELDVKAIEAEAKAKEQERQAEQLQFTQQEAHRNRWANPLVVAVFAAAVAAAGNATVALLNGGAQREVEQVKADQALILEAIKANSDPDKAAANLRFFADTALISNARRRGEIITFLNQRRPGEGPALPSATPGPTRAAELFERVSGSVGLVTVQFKDSNGQVGSNVGTSFIVNNEGHALTAAHLLPEGATEVRIIVSPGSAFSPALVVQVVSVDREQGLALLKYPAVPGLKLPPVRIARAQLPVGSTVSVLGFSRGTSLSLSTGAVSSLDGPGGAVLINAVANEGQSGSPVFNESGEVVAVLLGSLAGGGGIVARPIRAASRLLALAGIN